MASEAAVPAAAHDDGTGVGGTRLWHVRVARDLAVVVCLHIEHGAAARWFAEAAASGLIETELLPLLRDEVFRPHLAAAMALSAADLAATERRGVLGDHMRLSWQFVPRSSLPPHSALVRRPDAPAVRDPTDGAEQMGVRHAAMRQARCALDVFVRPR